MRLPSLFAISLLPACVIGPALAQQPTPSAAAPTTVPATAHGSHPPVVRPRHPASARVAASHAPAIAAAASAVPTPAPAPAAGAPEAVATAAPPRDPAKGTDTGLPLPRWASLRSDEVNMRAGPGNRYPIDWVYKRRDLPVQVLREFEKWRLVIDQDQVKGWVNQATLVTRRDFVVTGAERVLREAARDDADAVARLAVGVVGRIRGCAPAAEWCEVQTGDYRGWLRRDQFWGTAAGEAIQ